MPRIGLEVSIDAENIAKVEAVGNDFRWLLYLVIYKNDIIFSQSNHVVLLFM